MRNVTNPLILIFSLLLAGWMTTPALAQSRLSEGMGLTQRLGETAALDVPLRDENGRTVTLRELAGKRPLLVVPVVFRAEAPVTVLIDDIMQTLAKLGRYNELIVGQDVDVAFLSLDPREGAELALRKKGLIIEALDDSARNSVYTFFSNGKKSASQPNLGTNMHLLTGGATDLKAVTDSLGFQYVYIPERDIVNFPAATILLTPQGRISQYTVGTDWPTIVAKNSIKLANQEKIGEKADQTQMFGFVSLDPNATRFRTPVHRTLQIVGTLFLIGVIAVITSLSLRHRREPLFRGGNSRD